MHAARVVRLAALLFAVASGPTGLSVKAQQAMAKDAQPVFDVVTVKPTPPDERNQGFQTRGSHIKLVRETVLSMMMFAYGVHGSQVIGAPDWAHSQAFNVDGVPNVPGEPNTAQFQSLVKQLLIDRFGLKTHPATRDLSYYALRVAPAGPKLVRSTAPDDQAADQTGNGSAKGQTMTFTNNTMPEFALGMQYFADRPVINETGLTGKYDFTLQWTPDSMKVPDPDAAPGMFAALREQLGLEMKSAKGSVNTLVVDAVTEPSAN